MKLKNLLVALGFALLLFPVHFAHALPLWIDISTPDDAMPAFTGEDAPYGYPGAIPIYQGGRLHWLTPFGQFLSTSEDPREANSSDNVTVYSWSSAVGLTKGEYLILIFGAQERFRRALKIEDLK